MIEKALVLAATKHQGQKRKNGDPYIYHPLDVFNLVKECGYNEQYQATALLHDVLEDTNTKPEEILPFGNDVYNAVCLLTRTPGMDEKEYVDKILKNHIAAVVKNADKILNLYELKSAEPSFALRYVKKAREYYKNRFSAELDAMIDYARSSIYYKNYDEHKEDIIRPSKIMLYSDLAKEQYKELKNTASHQKDIPEDTHVAFVQNDISGMYYCLFDDGSAMCLTRGGWKDCENPAWGNEDNMTIVENMGEVISQLEKEDYFFDYVR